MFLKEFISDITVGSVIATREACVVQALINLPLERAGVVVEYGAGNGAFTRQILKRVPADCRVLAIESNQALARSLKSRIRDNRLEVIVGNAGDVAHFLDKRQIKSVDVVLSGIPFSLINFATKQRICADTARFLDCNGTFMIYQSHIPGGRASVERMLRPWFQVDNSKELFLNFPPLYVLETSVRQDLSGIAL